MKMNGYGNISFLCCSIIAVVLLKFSLAITANNLDGDAKFDLHKGTDLVADEVKEMKSKVCEGKKCGETCKLPGKKKRKCNRKGKCIRARRKPKCGKKPTTTTTPTTTTAKDEKPNPGKDECKTEKDCGKSCHCIEGECACFSHGRPFVIDGKYRTTTSVVGEIANSNFKETWKINQVPRIFTNRSLNQAIAQEFSNQGEGEHASVASFAQHTLQLLNMGAPPSLLMGSQKAALDEIKHAKMCYGIAGAFLGTTIQPSSLDVDRSVKSRSGEETIQSVINEGCIGETIAAVRAQLGAHYAKQPMVKDSLETIAADEANHAQLAWNTVQWAITRYPELQTIAKATFQARIDRPLITMKSIPMDHCDDCEKDSALHDNGLLLDEDQLNTEVLSIQNVIHPVVRNEFQNVEVISTQIMNMDFSKYQ